MDDIITRLTDYKKARRILFSSPLFILFLLFILFNFLLPDYFGKEKDLITDSSIIKKILIDKYPEHVKFGTVYKNCLDIFLIDRSYFIRLNDGLGGKYWPIINDTFNMHKKIDIGFESHLLHDNILYNPNKISIDGKDIIPYGYEKKFVGLAILVLSIVILILHYVWYGSFRKCKEILKTDESNLEKTSWQLFLMLIRDEI